MADDPQHQTTRWAVIRVRGDAREIVDTWSNEGDARAEAMHLMTRRRSDAIYFVVEPANG